MRVLVDQNISQRILPSLAPQFDALHHVRHIGLTNAEDHEIFMFARDNGYQAVISIDDDFIKLIHQFSKPPKIIWIRTGNCSTALLLDILHSRIQQVRDFIQSEDFDIYEVLRP